MNFNHLYYFHCIAAAGSITAAAKSLGLSQPSLSTQLRDFELSLSAPLFVRTGRELKLTPVGRKIFSITTEIFGQAAKIPEIAASKPMVAESVLRVGVSDDIEFPFVADLMCEHLNKKIRDVAYSVKLLRCSSADVESLFAKGSLDAAVLSDIELSGHSIISRRFDLPVFLAMQYGASSAPLRKINVNSSVDLVRAINLLPFDLVLPSCDLRLREETDLFFARRLINKRVCFETSSLSALIRAIAEGVGFGFVPGVYAEDASRLKRVQLFGPKSGLWRSSVVVAARDSEMTRNLIRTISRRVSFHNV